MKFLTGNTAMSVIAERGCCPVVRARLHLLQRIGENSTSFWLQFFFAVPTALVVGVLGNAIWAAIQACGEEHPAVWGALLGEAWGVALWTTIGALVAVVVLHFMGREGRKAQARRDVKQETAQARRDAEQEAAEATALLALHHSWPPHESILFVAEKCVLHADGRFVVAFICINKSKLVWNIRRSVLTNLRSGKGAVLRTATEDHGIHKDGANQLLPGGFVRTVFKGTLVNLDPEEWVIGNFVTLYMGHNGVPQTHRPPAGHLMVYGESITKDAMAPFTALDGAPIFVLHGKVQT